MAIKQTRNDELIDNLRAEVQMRYEPQFAWKSACSQFQALTGLRGFWPTSAFEGAGHMMDQSGNVRTLSLNGDPVYGVDSLIPYIELDGVGDYFSRGDEAGFDITGTETYVDTDYRGLTLGGWYRFGNAAGTEEIMMSKWDTPGNQRSYVIYRIVPGDIKFAISTNGVAIVSVGTTDAPAAGEWFFAAGRYTAATQEMDIWYNDDIDNLAVGVPASIHSGTANFNMGARHNGLLPMTGRLSLQFLCAAALPNAVINQLFHQTRAMFNV